MGLRSAFANRFGTARTPSGVPTDMVLAEQALGMDTSRPLNPGTPLRPLDGYSRTPRAHDYVAGYNIAARPRRQERVSFETLRGLIDNYDVAQVAIWHRIDSIRAVEYLLKPQEGYASDAAAVIRTAEKALAYPDHELPWASWVAKYLYDVLAYDAGCLYRMRNRAHRPVGLRVVDGTTIAPLID